MDGHLLDHPRRPLGGPAENEDVSGGASPRASGLLATPARRPVTPGGTAGNSSPASIAVKTCDVLGLYTQTSNCCNFQSLGDQYLYSGGNLSDGERARSFPADNYRLNISAV